MAMSKTGKVVLIVGISLVVLFFIAVIGLIIIARSLGRPDVADNSVLTLSVSGELPDYVPEEPFLKALGIPQEQSFSSLLTQLRKAKVDNRISAVVLDIDFPQIGWGKPDEFREAV